MKEEIYFMPLGGGQRVGASCYFLRLGSANIILDAGVGKQKGLEFEPDFHSLMTSPYIQSLNQINQIFISHAHSDHIGCLLRLMAQAQHAGVYMTEITKMLSKFQLYDRLIIDGKMRDEEVRLAKESLLEKINTVSYLQTIDFGRYRVTFLAAGHIPGAMMVLFETKERKILYTGDYSLDSTGLTQGCMIPDGMIDTVILCGLHAKHPDYIKSDNGLYEQAKTVVSRVLMGGISVLCYIPQLSKGIEFLKALNDCNTEGIPIYLDESVMNVIVTIEKMSIPILNQHNLVMGDYVKQTPHIYLTAVQRKKGFETYQYMNVDFSLHEDFPEMKRFLKKINPKQAVVVHCGKEHSAFDRTIEQDMMLDGECRTQFIFAEEKEIYKLW